MDAQASIHLWAQDGVSNPYMDLGGHKLTMTIASGKTLYINMINNTLTNGTIEVLGDGGWFRSSSKTGLTAFGGSDTLDVRIFGCPLRMQRGLVVHDYYAGYVGTAGSESEPLQVHGTFTPAAVDGIGQEYFYGCEMQDGSCIDLSAKSNTWDTTSTGFTSGSRTVTFVEGATVAIDVHGRTLAKGEQVVSWNSRPSNVTFTWDAATTALGKQMFVTDEGIYYDIAEMDVATAYWTGAANDNNVTNPANWACTNYVNAEVLGGLPLGSSEVHVSGDIAFDITAEKPLAYNTLSFDSVRLTGDCDWSGLVLARAGDEGDTVNFGSVDLNGHKLRLASPQIAATVCDFVSLSITDTSAGDPGELHLEVPSASAKLICTGLALSGNVKLVKKGLGWLAMARANQTFTGGVLIAEGKGYMTGQSFPETGSYWGTNGGTITVVTNATFDVCGNNGFYAKNFVLNGGTLDCSATISTGDGKYGIGNVTLVADSQFAVSVNYKTAIFSDSAGAAKIDLGGHTLTVQLGTGSQMRVPVPIENGTLNVVSGGYLYLDSGTSGGSSSVNVDMLGAALWTDGDLSVSNYVARYTERWNHGAQPIIVYGTFTPAAVDASGKEYFHGCVMQNGSSIDLSGKSNAWSVVSTGWPVPGYVEDANGNKTITFVNEATVGILLGTRKVKSEEKIIDWSSAAPANRDGLEFFGQFADGRRINLKAKDDGLYAPKKGMTLIIK